MRTMWQYDADGGGTLSNSERYYFMHDERWRVVATFRDQDAAPKESFVWHAAGGSGLGGTGFGGTGVPPVSSYIDSIILRDRDNYTGGTPNPMTSASDGTREERRFYCQNWRADVVAITASDGVPLEYVRYSAYGEATVYPVADLNMDGIVDSADSTAWSNLLYSSPSTAVYADSDLDFDGADDWASSGLDSTLFIDSYNENLGLSGKGRVSSLGIDNRIGYAGYQWDPAARAYHVRYRVYLPDIGRWTRRDPLGYVDGDSLYSYCESGPIEWNDSDGMQCVFPGPPGSLTSPVDFDTRWKTLCNNIINMIDSLRNQLAKRRAELLEDRLKLPELTTNDSLRPSESRRGHRELIKYLNKLRHRYIQQWFDNSCGDDAPPEWQRTHRILIPRRTLPAPSWQRPGLTPVNPVLPDLGPVTVNPDLIPAQPAYPGSPVLLPGGIVPEVERPGISPTPNPSPFPIPIGVPGWVPRGFPAPRVLPIPIRASITQRTRAEHVA